MARVLVLYTLPADPVAFDAHYTDIHIPLVHALPGLTRFELASLAVTPDGPSPYYLIATLEFPSMDVLQAALSSRAGEAAAADAATLMAPGSQILISDPREA